MAKPPPNIRALPTGFLGDGPGVQVSGAKELAKQLRKASGDVSQLKAANLAAAQPVADTAKMLVPVRSGALRDTIRAAGQATAGVVRAGTAKVPYAAPIHFGWSTRPNATNRWRGGPIAPQPFIYDALDQRRDDVIRTYERQIQSLLQNNDLT